uniref:Uncharacterized protein n=1 Tax=Anopheles farauti TaxID=69004 RepID=A0A182QU43_9DIPT
MAMVVSGRAKAVIAAFVCFFLLGIVLVTGSTKGWFVPMRYNERVAARVQGLRGAFARVCVSVRLGSVPAVCTKKLDSIGVGPFHLNAIEYSGIQGLPAVSGNQSCFRSAT